MIHSILKNITTSSGRASQQQQNADSQEARAVESIKTPAMTAPSAAPGRHAAPSGHRSAPSGSSISPSAAGADAATAEKKQPRRTFSIEDAMAEAYDTYPEAERRPVIGITANVCGEDYAHRQAYFDQIVKAGGQPIMLAPTGSIQQTAALLDIVDGIIMSGGSDFNPLWTNEEPHPQLGTINPTRDSFELPLVRLAYNRNIPVLGICRGMQAIAIALGGHVAQHISTSIKHSQDAPKGEPTHSIKPEPSPAPAVSGSPTDVETLFPRYVNSFHHQAVDNPGPMLRVLARAADRTIEAIGSITGHSILGVQWHPEQMGSDGLAVFQWLTAEARLYLEAKALHQRILTIDSHCDTPMFFAQGVDFLKRDPKILYDLHKMDEGRIDAVQMVCYLPQPKLGQRFSECVPFSVDGPAAYTDLIFNKIEDICRRASQRLSIACTPADIYRDKRSCRHSIVLGIENGIALEHDLKKIGYYRQRGVTYITLCHNGDNDICDSARGCMTHGGLSSFGREVIAEMNRHGIMVDLSHAAEASFYQALEVSKTPIVCSHSCCRALCDHPRNLTDDQMRALAAAGGVMQITMYHGFLAPEGKEATIDTFMQHLFHAIDIMGIDHVGIGTDFDGDGGVTGVSSAAELLNITRCLLRDNMAESDIAKLWGKNWLRVMAQCQGAAQE